MKRDVLLLVFTFAAGAGFGCNGLKLAELLITAAVAAVRSAF